MARRFRETRAREVPVARGPGHYPPRPELLPASAQLYGRYELDFARGLSDLDEILRLRFQVFNLELNEGLDSSRDIERDLDEFDPHCHHLLVRDLESGEIVGTYRMQTSEMASDARGFYSAAEFELDGFPREVLEQSVEVGRACVARKFRNHAVLYLLWRGLARYMVGSGKRFLFGCCSLTSQDPAEGWQMHEHLRLAGHMHDAFEVRPTPEFACPRPPMEGVPSEAPKVPKLFRTYLRVGAKACGPPAIDRRFKTIDFLVLFDLEAMDDKTRASFFG
jgi:putative hemolysin